MPNKIRMDAVVKKTGHNLNGRKLILKAVDNDITESMLSATNDNYLLSFWNIAGLILFVVGLSIAIVAAFTLGRFYASTLVIRDDHRLITQGVYRFARHPLYFGVIIGIFGVPVYAPSLYGFLVMSVLIPITLIRIRMEERLLTEEFGDAYRAYQKATSKLIPFIY